ncbi:MAG: helix-turn-helix transcriptional regulator [Trueperaceae bacterium]
MDVTGWLLDSDPAIRWQVMQDLLNEPAQVVGAERAKVATTGWGAWLLALQDPTGQWGREALQGLEKPATGLPDPATRRKLRELQGIELERLAEYLSVDAATLAAWEAGEPDLADERSRNYIGAVDWMWSFGTYRPEWTSTTHTLVQLRDFGVEPADAAVKHAVNLVSQNCKWDHAGQDYFDGEVEPCINGKTVALGAYFGQNVNGVVERLLGEQLDDGGWNCEAENGSVRSSFHTTIEVLEGLLEYERRRAGPHDVSAARARAEEYLLERGLYRRLSTGEVVNEEWTRFAYPPRWHYDVLRGLDYFRRAGAAPDPRCADAIALVESKRQPDGRWPLENSYPGHVHFSLDEGDGKPSRWNTLRALRVLKWYHGAGAA